MRKIFTTFLMMGVALCGWASVSVTFTDGGPGGDKIITVNYVDEGNANDLQNLKLEDYLDKPKRDGANVLKLTGDWTNKDLPKIGDLLGQCIPTEGPQAGTKKVHLDLSECTGMVSTVNYTGNNATPDWTSNDFAFLPTGETTTYTVDVTKNEVTETTYVYKANNNDFDLPEGFDPDNTNLSPFSYPGYWGDDNSSIMYDEEAEQWYIWAWNQKIWITKEENSTTTTTWTYQDQNGNTHTLNQWEVTDDGDGTYSYTYTVKDYAFTFADGNFSNKEGKLNGISFPNHANFTYIPANICAGLSGLENVVFGDYVQWIGENAFGTCSSLNDVTFPESLTVIGIDAFYGCSNFETVNLDLPNLVRVDAAAFNMGTVSDEKNNVQEVILPSGTNTTLKFWGNQVFSSSNVTSLDFSHCYGIEHFAYDGYLSFGHDQVHQGQTANSKMTFYYHTKLQSISFPPNLLYVGPECFGKCTALQTAVFNGRADYNKDTCPATNELNNPLIIDEQAFKDIAALTSVTLSDNITEIRKEAFQATGLTEIHIPASVQVIGVHAFQESKSLSVVYFDEIATDCAPCKHAKTVIAGEHRVQATDPDTGEPLFEEDGVTPIYVYTDQQATDPYTGELLFEEDGITPIYEIKRAGDGDGAFFHCPVTDVYINCPGANIICENKAFDYNVTFGQTDPDANFGTLHYPEGEEEKYVNLSHYLTNEIANSPGLFQRWLQDHFNWATKPNNNGWHEFINSGPQDVTTEEPPYEGPHDYFLRTYSDPNYARIVPSGIKAYIVKDVKANDGNFELTLQQLRVIPAQTGVILFGQPNVNAQGGSAIAMTAVAYAPGEGQPLRRDYWAQLPTTLSQEQIQSGLTEPDAVRMKNYLMPIIDNAKIFNAVGDTTVTSLLYLKPYEKDEVTKEILFRNFVLGHINNTLNLSKLSDVESAINSGENYAGFFRVVAGTKNSGYAYLHLDPTQYNSSTGAECVVVKDPYYTYEYDNTAYIDFGPKTSTTTNPNQYWQFAKWEEKTKLWGDRSRFNIPKGQQAVQFLGELEDEADGIVKVVVPATENGDYYTLQGVKVSNPTKGVYIHNGQKVIIK